jgi:hypothetical protein
MKRSNVFGILTALAIPGAILSFNVKRADATRCPIANDVARPTADSEKEGVAYTIEMLSTNKKGRIEGIGGIPVHFKARHKVFVAGPHQFVARATTLARDAVVAEHLFDRYVAAHNEERHDEFTTTLDVPPGEYQVEVELLSLYPVQDMDGNKIAEYLGQGNHVYRATSRPAEE